MHRIATRFALLCITVVVLALTVVPSALAHVPTVERSGRLDIWGTTTDPYPRAQRIEEPVKSLAIYGYLEPNELFDAYAFSVPEPVTTTVELLVPVRAQLRQFDPMLWVAEAGSANNVYLQPSGRVRFFEPFSATSFWRVQQGTVSLQPGKRYYFVVRGGAGKAIGPGAYVIGVGGPEAFSGADWTQTLRVLPVIWSGGWSGGPMRPGAPWCAGFVVLAVTVVIVAVTRRRRRGRH